MEPCCAGGEIVQGREDSLSRQASGSVEKTHLAELSVPGALEETEPASFPLGLAMESRGYPAKKPGLISEANGNQDS